MPFFLPPSGSSPLPTITATGLAATLGAAPYTLSVSLDVSDADLSASMQGALHLVVVNAGDPAPTNAEVVAGTASGGGAAVYANSIDPISTDGPFTHPDSPALPAGNYEKYHVFIGSDGQAYRQGPVACALTDGVAPVAVANTFNAPAGQTTTQNILTNDSDDVGLDVTCVDLEAPVGASSITTDGGGRTNGFTVVGSGVVSVASGVLTFVADAGFTGSIAFNYTVCDAAGNVSNSALVTISEAPAFFSYIQGDISGRAVGDVFDWRTSAIDDNAFVINGAGTVLQGPLPNIADTQYVLTAADIASGTIGVFSDEPIGSTWNWNGDGDAALQSINSVDSSVRVFAHLNSALAGAFNVFSSGTWSDLFNVDMSNNNGVTEYDFSGTYPSLRNFKIDSAFNDTYTVINLPDEVSAPEIQVLNVNRHDQQTTNLAGVYSIPPWLDLTQAILSSSNFTDVTIPTGAGVHANCTTYQLQGNDLTAASIDAIFIAIDTNGAINGSLSINQANNNHLDPARSAAGLAAKNSIVAKGWILS